MTISYLSNKVPWFGKYSGYECLPNYIDSKYEIQNYYSVNTKMRRFLGKSVNYIYNRKFGNRRNDEVWAAYKFVQQGKTADVSHVLYADNHLNLFKEFSSRFNHLTGTIHFPFSQWSEEKLKQLGCLRNGIILYKEENNMFKQYTNEFTFIRHGVDIEFFKPGNQQLVNNKKILLVGAFLRNFDMFQKVYEKVNKELVPDYEYHLIIPQHLRKHAVLHQLSRYENVYFHANLTDEELLAQYQTSHLLLMPMNDSGANTAIVQSLAVGLPVVTTDVGGIRSYAGGELYPIIKNNDVTGMVALVEQYMNVDYRNDMSATARKFAVEELDWHKTMQQHIDYYKRLQGSLLF